MINYIVPKVFIRCMTYNHVKYIKDTLDGFCKQKTDFPYVCGVIDDASTDGEQGIIQNYLEDNFEKNEANEFEIEETQDYIKYYCRNKINQNCYFLILFLKFNHYSKNKPTYSYVTEWRNKAKYIAVCEGDDYWIDDSKLQKQVDYLEINNNYSLCHTGFMYYYEKENYYKEYIIKKELYNIDNDPSIIYAEGYKVRTCTVLYKRSIFDQVMKIDLKYLYGHFLMSDTQTWILLMQKGSIGYIPEITSVYRLHSGSATRQKSYVNRLKFDVSSLERRVYEVEHKYVKIPFSKYLKIKMLFIYYYMLYHQIDPKYEILENKLEYKIIKIISEFYPLELYFKRYLSTKIEK